MTWMKHLEDAGGAATVRTLRLAGATSRALSAALDAGRLVRPRRGVYALPSLPPAGMDALRVGGRLSCVSAARSYGLWGGTDGRTHLRFPRHAGRAGEAAVRHWGDSEPEAELWRVSLADCLRSVVRCGDRETAIAVLDTALSAQKVNPATLRRLFDGEPETSRRIATEARPGSDSGVESILRQRLHARGHLVEQQVAVAGVGRVDMRVDGVLHVEVDGFAYHADQASFERDRLRDAALELQGLRRVRFAAKQVIDDADAVVAFVENVVSLPEEIRPSGVGNAASGGHLGSGSRNVLR
jgi:very-short-patch-repair endonuclease